jgi:predicted AlkP superfamily phosphohydrolase/phosphomutase
MSGATRTILVGLDGATFAALDPFMADGTMPNLRAFAAAGVRADLQSTPNPITPPAWTSLATGRSPGHHGILDFIRADERRGGVFFRIYDARDVRCETIWSIASRQGRRVTALNYFGTWPARPVDGYTIPGFVPARHLRRASYPRDLFERLARVEGFDFRDLGMDLDEEKKAVQGMSPEAYASWIAVHVKRERRWMDVFRYLVQHDPTDLIALVFDGVDKIQHLCWRFVDPRLAPPAPSDWERRIIDLCRDYFRQIDDFIGEVVRLAGPEARVFIASDHGFGASTELVYINVWLAQQGLLRWAGDAPLDDGEQIMVARLKSHAALIDWRETTAYAFTPSSNGICIRGVPPERYGEFRARLVAALEDFRDPAHGERVITAVRTREEVFSGSAMTQAPDLTLTLRDGGLVSILNAAAPLKPRSEPAGTHRPEGVFLAKGPGIPAGERLDPLSILEVTPALLHSIGLPTPEDFERRVPASVFTPAFLAAHPARTGPATVSPADGEPAATTAADVMDDADQELVAERLRRLGYLE